MQQTKQRIRKDILEIHKPSAMISVQYLQPSKGKKKGFVHYSITPFEHDAMNFLCYQAREQIYKTDFATTPFSQNELFEFINNHEFTVDLKELSEFTEKYEDKWGRTSLSNILSSLQGIRVKVGLFKQDRVLGDVHLFKSMSLIRNYTRALNCNTALFQLEPEILGGWIYKTKPYTKLFLKIQTLLKLSYSKILYENCKDYERLGYIEKPFVEWLKVLNFDSTLSNAHSPGTLKRSYLNKAVKEINMVTDINISNIKGIKRGGETVMRVEFTGQNCDLIDDIVLINSNVHYQRSYKKLQKLVAGGYSVINDDLWIGTDIKKNVNRYVAEERIDNWLKITSLLDKKEVFEMIAADLDDCDDTIVNIDNYRVVGAFSNDVFTKNPIETIEMLNELIIRM